MSKSRTGFDVIGQLAALRRYARSLTRDETEAEDLVHDALLRAYERRATFRPGNSLRAWLFSILHNRFIDGIRRARTDEKRATALAETAETVTPAAQEHLVRLSQIRDAYMRLPEEQRAVLHLVGIEGLAYQDAAEILGIPLGTLMSRLGRARATLRTFEDGAAGATRSGNLRIVGGSDA